MVSTLRRAPITLTFALAVALAAPAAPLLAQEPAAPPKPPQPAEEVTAPPLAEPPGPSPAAALLAAAALAQDAAGLGKDLETVEVRAIITTRDREKGTLNYDVVRQWKAPDAIRTEIAEAATGKRFVEGFDGTTAWLEDAAGVTIYEGPNFKGDRKRVREDLELMELMLRCFFLANLDAALDEEGAVEDATLAIPARDDPDADVEVATKVVTGRIELPELIGGESRVVLHFEAETLHLLRIRAVPDDPAFAPIELHLDGHVRNAKGVSIPQNVAVYRGDTAEPWQQIHLEGEEQGDDVINNIRFNGEIDPARFSPPAK
jgi:hypothetical protein